MSKKVRKKSAFETAVENTPDVATCYKVGLRALGVYSKLIKPAENEHCGGSVDIDAGTKDKYPRANRWDYTICYEGIAYFVEVHSAETSEVSTVLRKLQWLKDWLIHSAPELNRLRSRDSPFFWIQSGRFSIQKNSPQFRRAVKAGIKPINELKLPLLLKR